MMYKKRNQHGITLIEAMLVIAIAAMFIVLGIRQYGQYKQSTDIERLKQTVDIIFKGVGNYYRANCFGQYNPSTNKYAFTTFRTSTGDPNVSATYDAIPISLSTLRTGSPRYLTISIGELFSPLINNTLYSNGYHLQAVRHYIDTNICTEGTNATGMTAATGCNKTQNTGRVVLWTLQVSVTPRAGLSASKLRDMSDADCLTQSPGSGVMYSCTSAPATGSSVVSWERTLLSSPNTIKSNYDSLLPSLSAFTQMYRSNGIVHRATAAQMSPTDNNLYCID